MSKPLSFELLQNLSIKYGNAFYLLDTDVFEKNYIELTKAFKNYYPKFNIAYSYKTNYIPKLVQMVDRLGGYAEVVSDMEMEIAFRSGVKPEKIIWNGPIKNGNKIRELLLAGGTVNIDSLFEFNIIQSLAEKFPQRILNVGVRCNYDVGDGVVSRFGIDVDGNDFKQALSIIATTPNIHLINLQAHFAKRSPKYWTARAKGMITTYETVLERYGLKPERLDIGGGIYGDMPDSLRNQLGIEYITYDDYSAKAAKIFAEHFKNVSEKPTLMIEPGSALSGDCMQFVSRVETIKTVRGKIIVTVMGSQKNISMSGINPPIEVVPCGNIQNHVINADIAGFTCIEDDLLQKDYTGSLAVGDYIVVNNCGSYSLVMKPPFILPNFPVINICGKRTEVIKRAETFDDLFRTYTF